MRYYGGKGKLLRFIGDAISGLEFGSDPIAIDLFSGTAVVGKFLKEIGFRVLSNDYLYFCKCLATARVVLDSPPSFEKFGSDPIDILNTLPEEVGFFSLNYSPIGEKRRQYFSATNAMKIDAIRKQIHDWRIQKQIDDVEMEYLLAALIEAMNLTSNVSGTYAAYLKSWDPRALNDIAIRHPVITPGKPGSAAFQADAVAIAPILHGDLLYLDPPYNSRQYSSNYFLLDVAANGWFAEIPEVRGKTGMRDNSQLRSQFCSRLTALDSLEAIVSSTPCRYVLISYSNEGLIPSATLKTKLESYGSLSVLENAHQRYMANNHDPNKRTTVEYLYLLRKD